MVHMIRRQLKLAEQERGAVLVLTSFALLLLLGIAALVVDIVILQQARIRAQATVDSAVLAAVQDLPATTDAAARAQDYALRNYNVSSGDWSTCVDPDPLAVPTSVPCVSVDTVTSPTLIRVRLPDRQVPTFFAPLLGIGAFSVSATATAEVEYGSFSMVPDPDDPDDPADEQEIADFVRAGDPGGGYDTCGPILPPSSTVDASPPIWGEYLFVFEHIDGTTTTVCGSSAEFVSVPSPYSSGWQQWGVDHWIPGIGGTDLAPAPGMGIHVSCSSNFIEKDGWEATTGDPTMQTGPFETIDTNWHIILYVGATYHANSGKILNTCSQQFIPLYTDPHIRLSD